MFCTHISEQRRKKKSFVKKIHSDRCRNAHLYAQLYVELLLKHRIKQMYTVRATRVYITTLSLINCLSFTIWRIKSPHTWVPLWDHQDYRFNQEIRIIGLIAIERDRCSIGPRGKLISLHSVNITSTYALRTTYVSGNIMMMITRRCFWPLTTGCRLNTNACAALC